MKNSPKFYEKEYGRNNVFQIFTGLFSRKVWLVIAILFLALLGGIYLWLRSSLSFPTLNAAECSYVQVIRQSGGYPQAEFRIEDPEQIETLLGLVEDCAGRNIYIGGYGQSTEQDRLVFFREDMSGYELWVTDSGVSYSSPRGDGVKNDRRHWRLKQDGYEALLAWLATVEPAGDA